MAVRIGDPGVAVDSGGAVSRIGVSDGGGGLGVALGVTACSVAAAMAWAVSNTWSGETVAVASGSCDRLQPAASSAASRAGVSQRAIRGMLRDPSSFGPCPRLHEGPGRPGPPAVYRTKLVP